MASSRLFAQVEPLDLESIPRSGDYILRSWVAQDGMPDAPIQGLAQTPDGYLWLAGAHVLMRFDGVRFTAFPESSGWKLNSTSTVLTARDGTLWAAFGEGSLTRLRDGRFQVVIPSSSHRNRSILSLAEDAEGGIWASFSWGGDILRWKGGKTDSFQLREGGNPISLCSATNGVVWFTSYTRYGFFNGREFQFLPLADRGCGHLAASREGGMWTVAGRQLLHLWENGKTEVVAELSWLGEAAQVNALYEDREGNLWIGSQGAGGLVRFRDGKFERVPTSFFLIDHLYETRDGNLWVTTGGGSLDCLSPRQVLLHTAPVDRSPNPMGPRDIRVSSLAGDEQGRVWMTQGQSLVRATDATNRKFALAPGWRGPNGIFSLQATPSGEIWIGGGPRGLRCWKDSRLQTEVPLPGSLASFLLGDAPHQTWTVVKPNPGVYEYRGKDFTLLPESAGIPNPVALALDPQKRLWVGTADGRVYYRQGTSFVEAPMPEPKPGDMVVFLVPDGPDTVWIGCDQSGLYRWRSGRIDKFPPDTGLPARNLRVLEIAPNGNFWFGALVGLIRVSRAELEAVLDGRQSTVQAVTYGPNLGMPATAGFHYGFLQSARTIDGHLWFGTTLGGAEVIPEYVSASAAPPAVLIEEILVRGKSIPLPSGSTSLVLPPRPGTIQIRYTLPELGALEQESFRFRMLVL
jgi:ligand-binding sensor domain-containing protein